MGKANEPLRVMNIRTQSTHTTQTCSADLVVGRRKKTVWFRTDAGRISGSADPFIPVALIPAMRRNWPMVVDGRVSAELLDGTQSIQTTMTGWYPEYRRVPIQVTSVVSGQVADNRQVATFFSGGVDSFYTLRQHRDEISHLIFVHGLDIPLGHARERRRASDSVRGLAASLGLQLVEVETNLRQFGQPHVSWPKAYVGAALASVALLLSPRFGKIYLPATAAGSQLEPMGTHPELDPKWSNGSVQLVHDGLRATRFEKVGAIADWQPVSSHLRVCYQRNATALNCGRCRKCLWTMMMLSATGYLDRVETFSNAFDLKALQLYPPASKFQRDRFVEALSLLEQRDADPGLRAVLRAMLDANGRIPLRGRLKRILARAQTYVAHRFAKNPDLR